MKRRYMVPVAVVAMFGLLAAFATIAQAYPSRTTACTGCHSGVNVPITATAGAGSATSVSYTLEAPSSDAIAVFDGAIKVATLVTPATFDATVGKTYTAYAVAGPSMSDGIGSTTFTVVAPVPTPTAPAAPVLDATYSTSTGAVTIAWAAVTGATSYDYQVGSGSVVSTAGTSVSLTGLAEGDTAFKLRATNSSGSSAYTTATIVYTAPIVAPDPGAGFTVTKHLRIHHRSARQLTAVLTDSASGATFTAMVDHEGNVTFTNVPAGTYRLTVTGGEHIEFHPIRVVVGAPAESHEDHEADQND